MTPRVTIPLVVLLCGVALLAAAVHQQETGPVSGPREIAARYRSSIFLVTIGSQKCTGFLVSHDPPLIGTVAHTTAKAQADDIVVHMNETGVLGTVRSVHAHAGFREDQGGKKPYSPDLALLELEALPEGCGPPLRLFRRTAREGLAGLPVVSLGFPFYSTMGDELQSAEAVVRVGVVHRVIDYDGNTRTPPSQRPMLEHDLDAIEGESGAPLLGMDGRVVAIHHGKRKYTKRSTGEVLFTVPVAIHVDEFWALLEQTNFLEAVLKP